MKKYFIKTSATVVLSFSLLLSGVSVPTPCNHVAVANKVRRSVL